MSALKPEYETFCRHYMVYANAAEAARAAGYKFEYASQQGHRLLHRPAVMRRLAELRAELVERECRTPDALLAKLEVAYRAALKQDQPTAAARIVEAQAKLAGLFAKHGAAGAEPAEAGAINASNGEAATRSALALMAKQLGLPAPTFAVASGAKA